MAVVVFVAVVMAFVIVVVIVVVATAIVIGIVRVPVVAVVAVSFIEGVGDMVWKVVGGVFFVRLFVGNGSGRKVRFITQHRSTWSGRGVVCGDVRRCWCVVM